ncbi:hypothetical protein CgunFtcFv8_005859 [Champsocephalus gunnari]|uniref:Uncharacterized protein n=1 Tax=Champsocephalus gunnari TaxID=52237 RepID=A0AAN8HDX5_CHAGU|nr:hypothetical protein CgunFtcFv8_005859 [Champsocephalus gunnari]
MGKSFSLLTKQPDEGQDSMTSPLEEEEEEKVGDVSAFPYVEFTGTGQRHVSLLPGNRTHPQRTGEPTGGSDPLQRPEAEAPQDKVVRLSVRGCLPAPLQPRRLLPLPSIHRCFLRRREVGVRQLRPGKAQRLPQHHEHSEYHQQQLLLGASR